MVRAAPPVRPTRLRLGPGRQRDHPMCRAPRRNQDGAPNMIAHRGAALKMGFTERTLKAQNMRPEGARLRGRHPLTHQDRVGTSGVPDTE
jgi:hypothetical protein